MAKAARAELFESKNFVVAVPVRTHIPRAEGGHIYIISKEYYTDRTSFPVELMQEMAVLSMIAGEAYVKAMARGGVKISRINYQENGNWAFRNGGSYPPYFHLHLYGRTEDSKTQTWGQALRFPDPDTGFYDDFEQLTEDDLERIREELVNVAASEKYAGKL